MKMNSNCLKVTVRILTLNNYPPKKRISTLNSVHSIPFLCSDYSFSILPLDFRESLPSLRHLVSHSVSAYMGLKPRLHSVASKIQDYGNFGTLHALTIQSTKLHTVHVHCVVWHGQGSENGAHSMFKLWQHCEWYNRGQMWRVDLHACTCVHLSVLPCVWADLWGVTWP